MVQPYNIGVKVGADIDPLRKGLQEGSKELQIFSSRGVTALRTMASGFAVVATAGATLTTGMVAIAREASQLAREITNLSKISGESAETFQALAYGAKTVGIENEKLADILKDVNERVGEFSANGAGPMKDFFEEIAPKIGVTIDQFKRLSGSEALQLYYDSLEKAGASQQQMTFYLEQMASDTTKLIPLLKDGGRGFATLAQEAENARVIISEMDLQVLNENSKAFDDMANSVKALSADLAVLMNPEIERMAELVKRSVAGWRGLIDRIKEYRDLADANEKANELLEGSAERLGQMEQAQGGAVNNLLQRQVELREKMVQKEQELFKAVTENNKARIPGLQKSLELMNESYAANEAQIQQLRNESELAKQIYDLRRGITEEIVNQQELTTDAEPSIPKRGDENEFGPGFLRDPFDPSQTDDPKKARMDEFSFGEDDPFATEQELFAQHWDEMNRIAVEGAGGISQIMAQQWGNAVGSTAAAGKSMMESFSQSSRKMFEINKAWGIADAIVSTAQGIAAGVKLGWPMGIPAVAWAVANGAAQISRIRSTQFGGGGGTPTATTSAPAQGQAAPGTNALGGQESGRTLRIEGLRADSLYTGNQLQNLATNLEEFWNDGGGKGRVIFAGDK